jgi:CRISPR-associated protein Cas1
MRKLLNTVYVTNDQAYLTLDNNNLVCSVEGQVALKMPFDNIENIVCFSYMGCSPALMGKCVEDKIPINFISPTGKYWAKICGETKGNVYLRIAQIDQFRKKGVELAVREMQAKFSNHIRVYRRSMHDYPALKSDTEVIKTIDTLQDGIVKAEGCTSKETLLGIEGNCASAYFSSFPKMLLNRSMADTFQCRNKRPPLDPVNALLSFFYTLATSDCAAALETVGLDSYIGFYHELRSGRVSLACDMVEEMRGIVERFVITLVNLRIVGNEDFDHQASGAVWLNSDGKKKALQQWQEKKRSIIYHKVIKEKIPLGLLPYVQSNLLAKYIRGEIEEYIPYLQE